MTDKNVLQSLAKQPNVEEILERLQEIQRAEGTRFIPASDWNKYHPWPPAGGLRHLIFFAKEKKFDQVITRVGRRVLINEKKFFEFLEAQNAKKSK